MMHNKDGKSESDVSTRFGAVEPPEGVTGAPRGGADRRRFPGWKLLVVAGMLAAGLGLAPSAFVTGTAVGQAPAPTELRPSVPGAVTVTQGDTEATITWSSGGNGNGFGGGTCDSTEYYVVLFHARQSEHVAGHYFDFEGVTEESDGDASTSWFVDELRAGDKYLVEVYSYGSSCDHYSRTPASKEFITNASTASGDPTAPSPNQKKMPRRVRELNKNAAGTSVVLTWKRPTPGNLAKRCDLRDSESSNKVEYSYEVKNTTTGDIVFEDYVTSAQDGEQLVSVTVMSLVSGTKYRASVSAYSPECDDWSRYRYTDEWTQP